jgi:hypothetical protein
VTGYDIISFKNKLVEKIEQKQEIIDNDCTQENLKNCSQDNGHFALTLAIKTRSTALPILVNNIKNTDNDDRQQILQQCNTKNLSLIDRSLNIDVLFKNQFSAQRNLYLLELERLSIGAAEKPVRLKLFNLLNTLNGHDLTTDESKAAWITAITKTQQDPLFANQTGALFWCKSAINFVTSLLGFTKNKTPEGYGIGFFKPDVNTLLVEMSRFPLHKPK